MHMMWTSMNPLTACGALCHVFGPYKYGVNAYRQFVLSLRRIEWNDPLSVQKYQVQQLQKVLAYAAKYVPYYRDLFRKLKFNSDDVTSLEVLQDLPILSRQDVVEHFDRLVSSHAGRMRKQLVMTSGSVGKPMRFYLGDTIERTALARERMAMMGVSLHQRNIKCAARPFVDRKHKRNWYFDPCWNRLVVSSIGPTKKDIADYVSLIKRFKPHYIIGGPSLLYALACYTEEENIHTVSFSVMISSSENLYAFQREKIEQRFKCTVFDYYSLQEDAIAAYECSYHTGLHQEARKGIVEIVDDKGSVVPEGQQGRIIGTAFHNYVMPLIRYDTGDRGTLSSERCACGSALPLLSSIDGRSNERIFCGEVSITGARLSEVIRCCRSIRECQFVQEKKNSVTIRVVKSVRYQAEEIDELVAKVQVLLTRDMSISVAYVEAITRTEMGKFPFIINTVDRVQ